jgi:ADP-heptose:LPS heptosyltransferase
VHAPRTKGRILVIRGGAIGDFILTLPALAALRRHFPQTHLEVLGYPNVASLAKLSGDADEVRSIEARALAGFFARGGTLDLVLCEHFGTFNIVVSYLYDPDRIFEENVARCSKAQFIVGPHRPNEREDIHATNVYLKPLERLAIFGADPAPRIALSPGAIRSEGKLLAIHPGSGSEKKNWPEEHWEALLRRVAGETPWRVLLIGGEAEGERLQRLATLLPVDRLSIALHQPLPELARRMAVCDAFAGHDSGITHLAAALGLRGVALWGETRPEIWRPRSDRFALLRDPSGLKSIDPGTVFAALSPLLS